VRTSARASGERSSAARHNSNLRRQLTRWFRISHLGIHLLRGAFIAGLLFPLQSPARRNREIEHWSARLCEILGVRVFLHGAPPSFDKRPLMVVANHVSWVDIFAINAVMPVRFVGKAEIRKWPLVGWLCARAGTLFIQRARRQDTLRVNEVVAGALRNGDVFAVFPEGTTTDGSTLLKFHSSLLEPALQARAVIQPVAVRYEHEDGSLCTEAAYDGPKSVWDALTGIVSQRSVIVHVCLLPLIAPCGRDRRTLAFEAWESINLTLFPRAPNNHTETGGDRRAAAR